MCVCECVCDGAAVVMAVVVYVYMNGRRSSCGGGDGGGVCVCVCVRKNYFCQYFEPSQPLRIIPELKTNYSSSLRKEGRVARRYFPSVQ